MYIEWLVLEVKGNQALVISKDAIIASPYNSEDMGITWEMCSLRLMFPDRICENTGCTIQKLLRELSVEIANTGIRPEFYNVCHR